MGKKINLFIILFLANTLIGCSWNEYFCIFNTTNSEIIVEYKITDPDNGIGIFTAKPYGYLLNKSDKTDWDKAVKIIDKDTADMIVRITIKSHSMAIIGILSNDTYHNSSQKFINGRVFNMDELKINTPSGTIIINPGNFDAKFLKEQRMIKFVI